ncbi:MAG TPA: hypothetical protein G4O08_11035 [Anaerolineae bacterium]|nr:hypothetical protein [Anaerolineae bacterium]
MSNAPEIRATKTSIVVLHILYLLAGVFLSGGRWIFLMLGPAIGFSTFVVMKPQPREASKQGAIGGATAALGLLLPLLSWISPEKRPASGSILLQQLGFQVAIALGTILLSALTAYIITRKPRARDLESLEYRSLVPSRGIISVACKSCAANLEIPTGLFHGSGSTDRPQSEGADGSIQITQSGQNYYDLSHLPSRSETAIGCLIYVLAVIAANAIVGLFGAEDITVYVIWTLTFVAIAYVINKPLIRLMGGRYPIWVAYCPECGTKIAIATNGKAFFAPVA